MPLLRLTKVGHKTFRMGCKAMSGNRSKRGADFNPRVKAWMRAHTVGDLRVLATNMECKGEDATAIREVVEALTRINDGQLPGMGGN